MTFRQQMAKQIEDHIQALVKEKVFDAIPSIRENVTFGCGDYRATPYHFYTWADNFLMVDGTDLYTYPEGQDPIPYFKCGTDVPIELDDGARLEAAVNSLFDDYDFAELLAAHLFLSDKKTPVNVNALTFYKNGDPFKFE